MLLPEEIRHSWITLRTSYLSHKIANMPKHSKQLNRTNQNPYAVGFSPSKVMKLDKETGGQKTHELGHYTKSVLFGGGMDANDDGYHRHSILACARGSSVVDLNLDLLADFRALIFFIRNGEAFPDETASNGIYWSRHSFTPADHGAEELISLDHYLIDDDVVRVMEAHNQD